MNVAGAFGAACSLGHASELARQGVPASAILASGLAVWFWPIELWACSVWASRRLLCSGQLDLAALTALLPMVSLPGIRLLQGL